MIERLHPQSDQSFVCWGNAFEVSESLMMLQNMYRLPKGGGSKGEGSNWEPG